MEEYSIFEAIYLSFYSKALYRQVATTWGGKAFLFALLMSLLTWVASVIHMQHQLSLNYATYSGKLTDQMPVMTIENGKITTPENRPYVVKDTNDLDTLLVVDTSGQIQSLEQANTGLLITQTSIITKSGNETKIIQLPTAFNYTMVPMVVNEHIKSVVGYLWIVLLPGLTLGSWIFLLAKGLFFALLGRIFSAITHAKLTYSQCYLLFLVAASPSLILGSVFDVWGATFMHQSTLLLAVTVAYLFYAILVNKPSNEE